MNLDFNLERALAFVKEHPKHQHLVAFATFGGASEFLAGLGSDMEAEMITASMSKLNRCLTVSRFERAEFSVLMISRAMLDGLYMVNQGYNNVCYSSLCHLVPARRHVLMSLLSNKTRKYEAVKTCIPQPVLSVV